MHSATIVQKLDENKSSAMKTFSQSIPLSGRTETISTPQTATFLQDSICRKSVVPSFRPVISGIIGNGKEKFALLRWQNKQGIFRRGETLENAFYITEITDSTVSFSPLDKSYGKDSFTLTLF